MPMAMGWSPLHLAVETDNRMNSSSSFIFNPHLNSTTKNCHGNNVRTLFPLVYKFPDWATLDEFLPETEMNDWWFLKPHRKGRKRFNPPTPQALFLLASLSLLVGSCIYVPYQAIRRALSYGSSTASVQSQNDIFMEWCRGG